MSILIYSINFFFFYVFLSSHLAIFFKTHDWFYVKHSVYTTHVGPWLHRHRLVHTYTHAHAHAYTGWSESGVGLDARATRSIHHVASTPRNRWYTPSTPPLSLLFLSFSLPSSLLSTGYPSAPWPTCSPTPGKRDDTMETGFRPAEDSERKYSAQQNFSTHAPRALCKKKEKKEGKKNDSTIRENLSGKRHYSAKCTSRFFEKFARA